MRTDTVNRLILAVIGTVLTAVSLYGLTRGFDGFGRDRARQALITPETVDWLRRNQQWVWPVVGIVGAVVAVAAFQWLRAQLHTRPGRLDWTVHQPGGVTTIAATGVASAVQSDLIQLRAVDSADVRLVGDPEEPRLDLRVSLHDDVALADVLTDIATRITPRICDALELDDMPTTILIELVAPNRRLQ